MTKNLVVCLDGTNNKIKAQRSNVLLLYNALEKGDPDHQVAYYQPGVGTFSSPGTWTPVGRALTRGLGSAFGFGFRQNLGDAYRSVMATYQPGDKIFIFGFSRGAYTARALVGMLDMYGVFRPGAENLVPHAVDHYMSHSAHGKLPDRAEPDPGTDEHDKEYWRRVRQYAQSLSVKPEGHVAVHFLGLWDTVNAIGTLRRKIRCPFTFELPHVGAVRHALAIDERRRPYQPYRVKLSRKTKHRFGPPRGSVKEVWFAGVHSDVGGSFADNDAANRIWRIPLLWMAREAAEHDLVLDPEALAELEESVTPALATGRIHTMGGWWRLMYGRRRPLPKGAHVHASVRDRLAVDPGYARRQQVADVDPVFVDENWLRHEASSIPRSSR